MTAFSDETGRDFPFSDKETLAHWLNENFFVAEDAPEKWDDLPEWHRTRFRKCAQMLWHVIAALSASPVGRAVAPDLPAFLEYAHNEIQEYLCPSDDRESMEVSPPDLRELASQLLEKASDLRAAPVAQEPAWRYEIQHGPDGETDWAWVYDAENNLVCTAKTCHAAAIVRASSPPATPAGLGADEIAQIIATKCFDPRVIDSSGKPFWKKSQWREAQQAANAILALLSRAGDQKRPHEA